MASIVVGTLRAILALDSAQFIDGIRQATGGLSGFDKNLKNFSAGSKALGQALLPMSAAVAGLGGFAIKSAMDFQDSFAGIGKTVEGVVDPLGGLTAAGKALSEEMRAMSRQMPINVNELNKLGETAGAMGIPMEKVAEFSKTMALLGVTTELSAQQAATSIAQIQSIYGSAGIETDRFANTLVHLGNKGSSTEAQILELAQRLAGAGKVIGLTQPQVLGFAAAMANVGINAEAGGTALSAVFNRLDKAVATGGARLTQFATVAEMSAEQFARTFQEKPAVAIEAFVVGLGKLESKGVNVNVALQNMGLTEARLSDTLKRLSGNTAQVTQALIDQEEGWRTNNAMTNEAQIRFQTVSNQLAVLWNKVRDVGISLGEALLPMVIRAVDYFTTWIPTLQRSVDWFSKLDPATQKFGVALAGLSIVLPPLLIALGALAGAVALIGAPLLAVGAALAAVTLAFELWWDDVTRIVENLYTDIKMYLNEKLFQVFTAIKSKIDSVKGYFRDLYEAVVGHSYIKDTVNGIGTEVAKLDVLMVKPTQTATKKVERAFEELERQGREWSNTLAEMRMAEEAAILTFQKTGTHLDTMALRYQINTAALRELSRVSMGFTAEGLIPMNDAMMESITVMASMATTAAGLNQTISQTPSFFSQLAGVATESLSGLNSIFQAAFTGGGGILGAVQSFATRATASLLGMVPVVGPVLEQFAGSIVALFSKLFNWGGPSAAEKEGRSVAAQFRDDLAGALTEAQRMEVQTHINEGRNKAWAESTIAIRDAYLEAGRTEREALDAATRLWEAERRGGSAVRDVINEITAVMRGRLTPETRTATSAAHDLGVAFQNAGEVAVSEIEFITGEVKYMREEIGRPILIPIEYEVGEPPSFGGGGGGEGGGGRTFGGPGSDQVWRFLEDNPGDYHRIPSALGISESELHNMGVPGYQSGTPWLQPLDFGSGSLAMLHGRETIVPVGREGEFAAKTGAVDATAVADLLRTEFARMNQLLPTMVVTAVRDQLQLGARRR